MNETINLNLEGTVENLEMKGAQEMQEMQEKQELQKMQELQEEKPNYLANFFKETDHGYNNFFNSNVLGEDIALKELKDQIEQKQKEMTELNNKIVERYSRRYNSKYEPVSYKYVLTYSSRLGAVYYFDFPSGQPINFNSEDDKIKEKQLFIELSQKNGDITVIDGFCYEKASIILKYYHYSINAANSKVTFKLINESLFPFFSENCEQFLMFPGKDKPHYLSALRNGRYDYRQGQISSAAVKLGNDFINTLYGININIDFDLYEFYSARNDNAAFETILKTAPADCMEQLLQMKIKENVPVYKLLNLDKESYKLACDKKLTKQIFELKEFIDPDFKSIFNKTPEQWMQYIEECKEYEKDLSFYGISYGSWRHSNDFTSKLAWQICDNYKRIPEFNQNYSLSKFTKYVVNETINQGYGNIDGFMQLLKDYIRMCKSMGIRPCYYTNNIQLSHDITSRNHKMVISVEDEAKFINRYVDFKTVNVGEYKVYAPNSTDDVKKEGDNLSHCVGSYIKRVIDGESLIYFLREKEDESLITLEVKDGKINQARGFNNRNPYEEEIKAIKIFADKAGLELDY